MKKLIISKAAAIRFVKNFLAVFFLYWVLIYLAVRFSHIFNGIHKFLFEDWIIIVSVSLISTVIAYIREIYVTKRENQSILNQRVIENGIIEIIDLLSRIQITQDNLDLVFTNVLRKIQRVIEILLNEYKIPKGVIGVNLMFIEDPPPKLVIKYLAEEMAGHASVGFDIPFDRSNPLPGAPQAFANKQNVYVYDTELHDINHFFSEIRNNYNVRSFISIPIWDENKNIISILNIDSSVKNQFSNKAFIEVVIYPKIKLYLNTIRLISKKFMKSEVYHG